MGPVLLAFAIVMAGAAIGGVLLCVASEISEAFDIARRGWTRGHRVHHVFHARS